MLSLRRSIAISHRLQKSLCFPLCNPDPINVEGFRSWNEALKENRSPTWFNPFPTSFAVIVRTVHCITIYVSTNVNHFPQSRQSPIPCFAPMIGTIWNVPAVPVILLVDIKPSGVFLFQWRHVNTFAPGFNRMGLILDYHHVHNLPLQKHLRLLLEGPALADDLRVVERMGIVIRLPAILDVRRVPLLSVVNNMSSHAGEVIPKVKG